MTTKQCNKCLEELPLEDFYAQEKINAKGEKYIYYRPDCIKCCKKSAKEWAENNREKYLEMKIRYNRTEKGRKQLAETRKRVREKGYNKQYYEENKDQFKSYRLKRNMNKTHEITKQEWEDCKSYFNYSCAYCGISEEDAIETQGQVLHKEHVDHNGLNDLSNNIPSCKLCNGRKWMYNFSDWYNVENPAYSQERHDKIIKWLKSDYLNYIKVNIE